jgi:hypothetical protein
VTWPIKYYRPTSFKAIDRQDGFAVSPTDGVNAKEPAVELFATAPFCCLVAVTALLLGQHTGHAAKLRR